MRLGGDPNFVGGGYIGPTISFANDHPAGIFVLSPPLSLISFSSPGLSIRSPGDMAVLKDIMQEVSTRCLADLARLVQAGNQGGDRGRSGRAVAPTDRLPFNMGYKILTKFEIRAIGSAQTHWLTMDQRIMSRGPTTSGRKAGEWMRKLRDGIEEMVRNGDSGLADDTYVIHRFQLSYGLFRIVGGGCAAQNRSMSGNGFRLQSLKGKHFDCAANCAQHVLKEFKKKGRIHPSPELSTLIDRKGRLAKAKHFPRDRTSTPKDIEAVVTDMYGCALVVYKESVLMQNEYPTFPATPFFRNFPIGPAPPGPVVELVLRDVGPIYSQPGSAHYVVLRNGQYNSDLCDDENCVDRNKSDLRAGGVYHRHHYLCVDCGHKYGVSAAKHQCHVVNQDLMRAGIELSDLQQYRVDICQKMSKGHFDDSERIAQLKAVIANYQNVCVMGDGGTGKTFTTSKILKELHVREPDARKQAVEPSNLAFLCHDAIATENYESWTVYGSCVSTIHRFLGMKESDTSWKDCVQRLAENPYGTKFALLSSIKVCIVDEVWTVSGGLLNALNGALKTTHPKSRGRPFGGVQMIFLGDPRQRESIRQGEEERCPIFLTPLWNSLVYDSGEARNMQYFVLRNIRRVIGVSEDDRAFVRAQLELARGVASDESLQFLNSQQLVRQEELLDMDRTTLVHSNAAATRINHRVQDHHFQKEDIHSFRAQRWPQVDGSGSMVDGMRKCEIRMNRSKCYEVLNVAVGSRVMLTKNNYLKAHGVKNGSRGFVELIDEGEIHVRFDSLSAEAEAVVIKPLYISKSTTQFPLLLAWAVTVAKSQGMTLDKLTLDMVEDQSCGRRARGFGPMEVYVAVSRARSLDGFSIRGKMATKDILFSSVNCTFADLCEKAAPRVPSKIDVQDSLYQQWRASISQTGSSAMVMTGARFPQNMDLHLPTLSCKKPSVKQAKLDFWNPFLSDPTARIEQEDHPPGTQFYHTLEKMVLFDFETHFFETSSETPYSLFARFWENSEMKLEMMRGWTVKGSNEDYVKWATDDFIDWLMDIVDADFRRWADKKYPSAHERATVTLSAFNGSGFDFYWLMNAICHGTKSVAYGAHSADRFKNYDVEFMMRAKSIVGLKLFRDVESVTGIRRKECLTVWDPFLFLMSSLDSAVKSFLPEEKVGKEVFPHSFMTRVGPAVAFAEPIAKLTLDDFPDKMRKDVMPFCKSRGIVHNPEEGWCMFPIREVHDSYLKQDVFMLEKLVVAMDAVIRQRLIPGVSILQFMTIASLSMYGFILQLPKDAVYMTEERKMAMVKRKKAKKKKKQKNGKKKKKKGKKQDSEKKDSEQKGEDAKDEGEDSEKVLKSRRDGNSRMVHSRIHRLPRSLATEIRQGSVIGGRTVPRITHFETSDAVPTCATEIQEKDEVDALFTADLEGTPTALSYYELEDCVYYVDLVSMYVAEMNNRLYPTGPHLRCFDRGAMDDLLNQLRERGQEGCPFFIMNSDLEPNQHDLDPPLGRRKADGGLRWDLLNRTAKTNSVDLALAMKRRWRVSLPKDDDQLWAIVWGKYDQTKREWTWGQDDPNKVQKCRIFVNWTAKTMKLKQEGPEAIRVMAKTAGNSVYGGLGKKEYNNTFVRVMTHEQYAEWMSRADVECVYEDYIPSGRCSLMAFKSLVDQDGELSRNAPHLTSFILGYTRWTIDKATLAACPERMSGLESSIRLQVYNGDTDSLFVHSRSLDYPDFMALLGSTLGLFNDDLKGLYKAKAKPFLKAGLCKQCPKVHAVAKYCKHEIRFAKIFMMENPVPKTYALKALTFDGKVHEVKPKSKGIPKSDLELMLARDHEALMEAELSDIKDPLQRKLKRDGVYKTFGYGRKLTYDDLCQARKRRENGEANPGITAIARNKFKSIGVKRGYTQISRTESGELTKTRPESFTKSRVHLARTILNKRWEGRVPWKNIDSPFTVPYGWALLGQCRDPSTCTTPGCRERELELRLEREFPLPQEEEEEEEEEEVDGDAMDLDIYHYE